jgi:actin-like ATPase involved in cell morphogenesis
VLIAEDPLSCVAIGTGLVLENIDALKTVLISAKKLRI